MNRRLSDQFQLRLPDGMRDRLKAAADEHDQSLNAEIVTRLIESFSPEWPRIRLPLPMVEVAFRSSLKKRENYEVSVLANAIVIFNQHFPDNEDYIDDIENIILSAMEELDQGTKVAALREIRNIMKDFFTKFAIDNKNELRKLAESGSTDEELIEKVKSLSKRSQEEIQ